MSIKKGLYIVPTPIGNLEDITFRALNVLKNSDIILCEDTRHSIKLLNHYGFKSKTISYHKFNEKKNLMMVIKLLKEGKTLSIVSDAGTPTISDPGKMLIKECVSQKINIIPLPGPSAVITAMSASGFNEKFYFHGFLGKTDSQILKELKSLKKLNVSLIFFIPAVKINFYLKKFKEHFRDKEIVIAREMTKIHETFYRGMLKDFNEFKEKIKGELTVIISNSDSNNKTFDLDRLKKNAKKYLLKKTLKDTVKILVKQEKVSKKIIYDICLSLKK